MKFQSHEIPIWTGFLKGGSLCTGILARRWDLHNRSFNFWLYRIGLIYYGKLLAINFRI